MGRIEIAFKIAWACFGKPYRWGGDDPIVGFDCSGFVLEILQSVGVVETGIDLTAEGLFKKFSAFGCQPMQGALAFWKRSETDSKIIHVEFCIDEYLTIGASGGGSAVLSVQDAIEKNAFIKVRPLRNLHRFAGCRDPFFHYR